MERGAVEAHAPPDVYLKVLPVYEPTESSSSLKFNR